MSAVVKRWEGGGQKGLHFFCPGCNDIHGIRYEPQGWVWNGDEIKPTISPSILVTGAQRITDEEAKTIFAGGKVEPRPLHCHSFVREGMIEFLGDCHHDKAGQTVPLPPWKD